MEIDITVDDYQTVGIKFASTTISPPTGLTATAVAGGGTFAANTYFWVVTATTALGETTVSNEASAVIALNGSCNLAWTLPVGTVSNIKVYRGTAAGAENILVTTLAGTATTFTDTNVGAAGAPPASNTATIQDTTLMTGAGTFQGYTLGETSGTTAAFVEIQDAVTNFAEVRLSSGGSETENARGGGIPITSLIKMHIVSGNVRGTVWVGIPPVC